MIRNATVSDAAALWAVRRAAIQGISTEHYSKAQLSAWRDERTVHSYVPPIREKVLLVAEFQGKVIGLRPTRSETACGAGALCPSAV